MTGRTNGCCGGFWNRVGSFFRNAGHQIRNAFACCRPRNTPERPQTTKAELTTKQRDELAKIILQTVPSADRAVAGTQLNVVPNIQTHRAPSRQGSVNSDTSSVSSSETHPIEPEQPPNQPANPQHQADTAPNANPQVDPEPPTQPDPPPAGAEGGETSSPASNILVSTRCANLALLPAGFSLEHVQFETKDITKIKGFTAIINAAKPSLLGGGGVDGAIHNAASPQLLDACSQLPSDANGVRCHVGMAVRTDPFMLKANGVRHIIHTVGPDLRPTNGQPTEQDRAALSAAHHNSLALARQHGATAIALPAISCGVYQFPAAEAAYHALIECGKQENQELFINFCFLAADEQIKQIFIATKQALEDAKKAKDNQ